MPDRPDIAPLRPDISPAEGVAPRAALAALIRRADAVADGAPALDTIATGFPSVDKLLGGGLRRGDLAILGGDIGAGKSALALAMALRACSEGHAVVYVTGEMTAERVLERILAIEGRARVDDIRAGALDDATRASLGAAALRLRDEIPHVSRIPAGGTAALTTELRTMLALDLAVIDPLQSLPSGALPQEEELAHAVRQLKAVAVEANIALLVTAHVPALNRARPDARPTLDDFGALGAVKQHADVVLAIFREEMYERASANEGATELLVLKNRNGSTSYADLYFYKQWLRFEDMLDPDR